MEGNKKPLMGVVVNCMNESVSGFYKVKTGDGISGYCMSEFIKLC